MSLILNCILASRLIHLSRAQNSNDISSCISLHILVIENKRKPYNQLENSICDRYNKSLLSFQQSNLIIEMEICKLYAINLHAQKKNKQNCAHFL